MSHSSTCSDCGQPARLVCVACFQLFCDRHLIVRAGAATCEGCAGPGWQPKADDLPEAESPGAAELLLRDLRATLDGDYRPIVDEAAARMRLFGAGDADMAGRLVDDVQQYMHDTFADTTWPACPDHPNHPLWHSDGWWRCAQTGRVVAPLGSLADVRASEPRR